MTWEPIETAPTDGTPVLLQYCNHAENPYVGYFGHVGRFTSSPKMWLGGPHGAVSTKDLSHWMPLPEAPTQPTAAE